MHDRRAADILWLELRQALLAEAREHMIVGGHRILIDDGREGTVRFQNGQRSLDVQASREVVICTISSGPDPDDRKEVPIGLHPGTVPSFRLNGDPQFAEVVARKLLETLLEHES